MTANNRNAMRGAAMLAVMVALAGTAVPSLALAQSGAVSSITVPGPQAIR